MKKLPTIMVCLFVLTFAVYAFAGDAPKIKWGGLFYNYNFFHSNTDFDSNTDDGNSFSYIHADIQTTVNFGDGISVYTMIGAWGMHGMNPYWGCACQGQVDPSVRVLQGYLAVDKLFDTPFSLHIGKERLLYGDGAIFFDGGEDGATGIKLMYKKPNIDFDLFFYRLAQSNGIASVGAATYSTYDPTQSDQYPGNINAMGAYAIFHAAEGIDVHAYGVMRNQTIVKDKADSPLWLGGRLEINKSGLNGVAEYAMMAGTNEVSDVDYKGYHVRGAVDYTITDLACLGAYYLIFSGNDGGTGENETYESVINGPYTNGFYKDWPGFGPAHLMTTAWGFSGVDPGNITATNVNIINGHVTKDFGPLTLRFDFFNYARNWVASSGNSAMGNELALMLKYNYKNNLTIGATAGMWMPGDHIEKDWGLGDDADNAIGGYIWFAKGF